MLFLLAFSFPKSVSKKRCWFVLLFCHLKQTLLCIWNDDKTLPACFYCSAFPKSQRPGFGAGHLCGKHNWVLKGQCHKMDIFFEGLKILISTLIVTTVHWNKQIKRYFLCINYPLMIFRSFKSLSLPFTIINCLFASLKLLNNFENAYWTLLRIPFFVIGRCSLLPILHWLQGKCARINLLHTAAGMILQNHRRLPVSIFSFKIATLGSLNRLLEGFSILVSKFKGAS